MGVKERVYNSLLGLAIGDAVSWTAISHRSLALPFWTRRIRMEMDSFSETMFGTSLPMPFSLNRSAETFNISPTDDSEWAAFTANFLLLQQGKLEPEEYLKEWMMLANSSAPVRGRVSVQAAFANLRKGILPPNSGRYNPHYFDDGAMCRAVPIGVVCAGDPEKAKKIAEIDAAITNYEDGIWAAQAIAAAVSIACSGGNKEQIRETMLLALPPRSWIRRHVEKAVSLMKNESSVFDVFPKLSDHLINREYSYGTVSPEVLALTLIIFDRTEQQFEKTILTAASFAKTADSVPALVGALAGATVDYLEISSDWLNHLKILKGICIPELKNANYLELAEKLAQLAEDCYLPKISANKR